MALRDAGWGWQNISYHIMSYHIGIYKQLYNVLFGRVWKWGVPSSCGHQIIRTMIAIKPFFFSWIPKKCPPVVWRSVVSVEVEVSLFQWHSLVVPWQLPRCCNLLEPPKIGKSQSIFWKFNIDIEHCHSSVNHRTKWAMATTAFCMSTLDDSLSSMFEVWLPLKIWLMVNKG